MPEILKVQYSIDPAKAGNIVMNGSTGDDRLTVDAVLNSSVSATLNGDGGNDTLIGGAGNDNLNGGTGNDLYVIDTDTALGIDRVTDTSGNDTLDFSGTQTLCSTAAVPTKCVPSAWGLSTFVWAGDAGFSVVTMAVDVTSVPAGIIVF